MALRRWSVRSYITEEELCHAVKENVTIPINFSCAISNVLFNAVTASQR